ncbi:MAG: hypothetical protein M1828_005777 [Chrysothrix sp. TS-e1954]|nr:MAG: hypothetical protein M1828_005777 [Chrysothrix sp. TS-e1954]
MPSNTSPGDRPTRAPFGQLPLCAAHSTKKTPSAATRAAPAIGTSCAPSNGSNTTFAEPSLCVLPQRPVKTTADPSSLFGPSSNTVSFVGASTNQTPIAAPLPAQSNAASATPTPAPLTTPVSGPPPVPAPTPTATPTSPTTLYHQRTAQFLDRLLSTLRKMRTAAHDPHFTLFHDNLPRRTLLNLHTTIYVLSKDIRAHHHSPKCLGINSCPDFEVRQEALRITWMEIFASLQGEVEGVVTELDEKLKRGIVLCFEERRVWGEFRRQNNFMNLMDLRWVVNMKGVEKERERARRDEAIWAVLSDEVRTEWERGQACEAQG